MDVTIRKTQTDLARIQAKLYDDAAAAALLLQAYLGPDSVVSFVADSPTSSIPGSLIGVSPTQTVVIISGTTNQQQFAFQFLYFASGPINYGTMATSAQYWSAANAIDTRMIAAGVTLDKPLTIVGHSYGGAAATVLAGQILVANPDADVSLLTFGAPRAGDQRLYDLVDRIPSAHIVAVGDPVAALPPEGYELYPWFLVAPAPLYAQWSTMAKPKETLLVSPDGTITPGNPSLVNQASVWSAILAALSFDPLPVYAPHLMDYYYDRLKSIP